MKLSIGNFLLRRLQEAGISSSDSDGNSWLL